MTEKGEVTSVRYKIDFGFISPIETAENKFLGQQLSLEQLRQKAIEDEKDCAR